MTLVTEIQRLMRYITHYNRVGARLATSPPRPMTYTLTNGSLRRIDVTRIVGDIKHKPRIRYASWIAPKWELQFDYLCDPLPSPTPVQEIYDSERQLLLDVLWLRGIKAELFARRGTPTTREEVLAAVRDEYPELHD